MAKSKKVFAVHPGEILKTEFMEPMGLSAYELAKSLNFPGIYEVVRGDRSISADTAIRLGRYFGLPAQFWLNLQNDYEVRFAEACVVGGGIKRGKAVTEVEVGVMRLGTVAETQGPSTALSFAKRSSAPLGMTVLGWGWISPAGRRCYG